MRSDLSPRDLRILVAEDDEWIRKLLVRVLDDAGYRSRAIDNGIDALEELMQVDYDLAILDVQMPGMGAVEIARRCRSGGKGTPLIVLTADATSETADQCRKEGVQLVLAKPVRPDDLLKSIGAFVNGSHPPPTSNQPIQHSTDLIDDEAVGRLTQTCGQDFVDQLMRQFNQQAEVLLADIENSHLACDFRSVDELLHRFEGTAGTVGAAAIANVVRQLRAEVRASAVPDITPWLSDLRAMTRLTVTALTRKSDFKRCED